YEPALKRRNLAEALRHPRYRFLSLDLRRDHLGPALAGAEVVFHLAATPGLVQSWTDFEGYWTCNVLATQRLLEALRLARGPLRRGTAGAPPPRRPALHVCRHRQAPPPPRLGAAHPPGRRAGPPVGVARARGGPGRDVRRRRIPALPLSPLPRRPPGFKPM